MSYENSFRILKKYENILQGMKSISYLEISPSGANEDSKPTG